MYKNNKPIGIFDSGVGGLSVAKEVFKQIPDADVIYFGDTARVPYGPRPIEELISFADEITHFLIEVGAGVIIDACNSTSAVALDYLKEKYPNPIIGVVEPGINEAIKKTKNGRIGIIGTQATINSGAHRKIASLTDSSVEVFGQACPLFVPLVEKGDISSKECYAAVQKHLTPLLKNNIDTLILGCTHYPFLKEVIHDVTGSDIILIDPAVETVKEASLLYEKLGLSESDNNIEETYYVTGDVKTFRDVSSKLLRKSLSNIKKVIL